MIDSWFIGLIILIIIIFFTILHILQALLMKIELHDGGSGFEENKKFSKEIQEELIQNYSRIQGTLIFWKNRAILYGRLSKYTVIWCIISSYFIPILVQHYNPENLSAKLFLTILPCFSGLLIAISKGLKAEELYRNFRLGESEFFDLRRRLLDRPQSLGNNEREQVDKYFEQAEKIRQIARATELNNPPTANPI